MWREHCYKHTDIFIVYVKTEDIAQDIEKIFDTSNNGVQKLQVKTKK